MPPAIPPGAPTSRRLIREIAGSWPIPDAPMTRKVMASPPTPTLGSSATISSPATVGVGFGPNLLGGGAFRYTRAGRITIGSSEPTNRTIKFNNVNYGANTLANGYMASFNHYGRYVEIKLGAHNQSFMLRVNFEYVSLTPQAIGANDATDKYWYFDFGSTDLRRIDFLSSDWTGFRGVLIEQGASIWPAEPRGPRVVIIGDSQVEKSGGLLGIGAVFSDAVGWDNIISSAVGATGWANPATGGKVAIPSRLIDDVIALKPDIIINTAGGNDESYTGPGFGGTKAELQAIVAAGLAVIKSALPNVWLLNMGPIPNGGPGRVQPSFYTKVLPALRDAFLAAGGIHAPLMELPLADDFVQPPDLTTLAAASIDATTVRVSLNTGLAEMTLAPVDSEDRFYTKANSGSPAFTQTLDGTLKVAIANGKQLRVVGNSIMKGVGYVGATTGYGLNDIMVDTDGVHITVPTGARIIGESMGGLMIHEARKLQRRALIPSL